MKYIDHILSKNGIEVDEDKVQAIKQLTSLKNQKELGRFLDMVTYVAKFIPNLASITSNLRQLMKKSVLCN